MRLKNNIETLKKNNVGVTGVIVKRAQKMVASCIEIVFKTSQLVHIQIYNFCRRSVLFNFMKILKESQNFGNGCETF